MSVSVVSIAVALSVVFYWVWIYKRLKLDSEDEIMRLCTVQLREILQVKRATPNGG